MKHTKGEWKVKQTESVETHLDIAINSDTHVIGWIYSNTPESEANAKLIAAAPELLEALKYCASVFEAQLDTSEPYYKQAIKAIKKATE